MKRISIIIISIFLCRLCFRHVQKKTPLLLPHKNRVHLQCLKLYLQSQKAQLIIMLKQNRKQQQLLQRQLSQKLLQHTIHQVLQRDIQPQLKNHRAKQEAHLKEKQPHLNLIVLITIITVLLVVTWEDGLAVEAMSKNIGNRLMQSIFLNMKKEK